MKKVLFLVVAFLTMQVSAQDLGSIASAAGVDSNSLIDGYAKDQVKSLTKKLNLNETQQEQVSDLVVSQLKSEKFSKLIGGLDAGSLTGSGDQKAKIQKELYASEEFQGGMETILDKKQNKLLKNLL